MVDGGFNLRIVKLEYDIPRCLYAPQKTHFNGGHHKAGVSDLVRRLSVQLPPKRKIPAAVVKHKSAPTSSLVLIEQLLSDIYYRCSDGRMTSESDGRCTTTASITAEEMMADFGKIVRSDLTPLNEDDLGAMVEQLRNRTQQYGTLLVKRLHQRDALERRRARLCDAITDVLRRIHPEGDADMKFSVSPKGGANGWAEWLKAMKLVARLPAGIPQEFRRKLWITLAEQHLKVKGIDWTVAEKNCFSEWTNPDDTELGVQIVKDLHRTGCSLFCGTEGKENQAVLKRVLLAYARWNKSVGYCQGFNMLAALILEVMDRSEGDSLKVMIYLIEAVLPEGYFANNLRGLSVDMAVFRDLLKLRLPRLSAHLEKLQKGAAEGSCYEPPLTNVFTMQWFLTLFCNCLPRDTVLRIWDLVFLEGDEILLTTALAIWDTLQDRILVVDSADEFYSVMGELARQTLEAPPATSEALFLRIAQLGPVPELPKLRDKHRYNITPWAHSVQSAAKKGLRLFYSEDETDSSDEGDKLAITTAYGLQSSGRGRSALMAAGVFGHPDREKLALDISALKQQYARLRERQRQAHIILAAACARQPSVSVSTGSGPISVNHLLLGKSAIVSSRGRRLGPPQGAIPPSRASKAAKTTPKVSTSSKNDTLNWKDENQKKLMTRRDSIKWKDIKQNSVEAEDEPEEEGKVIPESEVNEILHTSMRTRRKSESSSYSECSESSTSTSLCDEPNRMSDFDSEPASSSENYMGDDYKDDQQSDNLKPPDGESVDESVNKNNSEFGTYVQEFEDLLDRTKRIKSVSEEDVNATLPIDAEVSTTDITSDVNEDNVSQANLDIESISIDNTQVDVDALSIGDTADLIFPDDLAKKGDPTQNETKSEHSFEEFVDSSQGKPLRNYLDEFRKADDAIKREKLWEPAQTVKSENEEEKPEYGNYKKYVDEYDEMNKANESEYFTQLSKIAQEHKEDEKEIIEDVRSYAYSDFRSNSCERSISSSVSSMSPVLRCLTSLAEENPAYICYKSPTRPNSEMGIELREDEKPIVFKIDKYFEHSPEYFGARKSGTSASSDDDDDSFNSKIAKPSSVDQYNQSKQKVWSDPFATDIESFEKIIQHQIDEAIQDDMECDVRRETSLSPLPLRNSSEPSSERYEYLNSPNEIHSQEPEKTIESNESLHLENALKNMLDKSPTEKDDSVRYSILEKTKSEDLNFGPKRSFSILDEEIEAIKSQSGRRNSEKALRIIQENSKILHRILINQVNKAGMRDCLQEESLDASSEVINQPPEQDRKSLRLFEHRSHKTLPSPRSASLDESLQRKNKNYNIFSEPLEFELKSIKSKDTTPESCGPKMLRESPKTPVQPSTSRAFALNLSSPKTLEENKTDLFGWENKGFGANQRISSYYKGEKINSKETDSVAIESTSDQASSYRLSSPEDKNSTLTAISDEVSETSKRGDYTESWKFENNNSLSESYNVSSPYKYSFSGYRSSKLIDSPLSRVGDTPTFTKSTVECSEPLEHAARHHEATVSQSSDLCAVSSSMSFSFDPSSVDEQPSSKPPTFNSSDTLCQLTSLDQVSTPISPKTLNFSLPRDSVGFSQRELSLELDKFRLASDESCVQSSLTDHTLSSLKSPSSPSRSYTGASPDKNLGPFPVRPSYRSPKDLGFKLSLYKDTLKSPSK